MAEEALAQEEVFNPDPQLEAPTGEGETPGKEAGTESQGAQEGGESPTPQETPGEPEKDNLQKRFDEMTAEKWALTRDMEERDRRIAELEKKIKEGDVARTGPQTTEGVPQRIDFDSDEAYVDALTDYKLEQKLARERENQNTERAEQQKQERQTSLRSKLAEGGAKHEDFAQIAYQTPFSYTPQMLDVMAELENPADVAYYLGKNHAAGHEIASLTSPVSVAMKLGQIEQMVKVAANAPEPKAVTSTPAPSEPTGGGGGGKAGHTVESLAKLDQADFNRIMRDVRKARGVI